MQMKCYCGAGSSWLEQAPEMSSRYRVECPKCHKFVKWGNQAQLDELVDAGENIQLVPYSPEPKGPTLDAFFVKE